MTPVHPVKQVPTWATEKPAPHFGKPSALAPHFCMGLLIAEVPTPTCHATSASKIPCSRLKIQPIFPRAWETARLCLPFRNSFSPTPLFVKANGKKIFAPQRIYFKDECFLL
jgi:hypothetical protein